MEPTVYRNGQPVAPALPRGVRAVGGGEGEEVVVARRRCGGLGSLGRCLTILGVVVGLLCVTAVVACLAVYLTRRWFCWAVLMKWGDAMPRR
jgi:hypothetical protein